MTTSDTHASGHEKQWEKGESFTWQLWDGDDMQTLWPVLEDSRVIAVATTEADRDAILAARAQAGLVQEMREAIGHANLIHNVIGDDAEGRFDSAMMALADLAFRYDALTAGPTAEQIAGEDANRERFL